MNSIAYDPKRKAWVAEDAPRCKHGWMWMIAADGSRNLGGERARREDFMPGHYLSDCATIFVDRVGGDDFVPCWRPWLDDREALALMALMKLSGTLMTTEGET